MSDSAPREGGPVAVPFACSPGDVPWEKLDIEGEAEVRTVIGPDRSASLGAGLARFRDARFDWSLDYDEVLYVLEGEVEVEHAGGLSRAGRGDVMMIPSGNRVSYRFTGSCTVFFATWPVDWQERGGG